MSDVPPGDLSTWIGSSVLVAGLGWGLRNIFGRIGESERQFRSDMTARLDEMSKTLKALEGGAIGSGVTVAALIERVAQVEKRQEEQARAHLERVDSLRDDLERRLQGHEDRCPMRGQ